MTQERATAMTKIFMLKLFTQLKSIAGLLLPLSLLTACSASFDDVPNIDNTQWKPVVLLDKEVPDNTKAFIAFGGMAEIPKRAKYCEKILKNKDLSIDVFLNAGDNLEKDFSPINDMRATKNYRMEVAKNLLIKCFHEIKTNKLLRVN